jgi:hypothetical protein
MADYRGVLADLRAKRGALAGELEQLDAAIAALEKIVQRQSPTLVMPAGPVGPPKPTLPSYEGMTLPRAVQAHMQFVDKPQTTRQVIDGVRAGGMDSDAPSFDTQVYNVLNRNSDEGGLYRRDGHHWVLRSAQGSDLLREAER